VDTKLKTKRIICLYGGPGCGKSTTCAGLFYNLKLMGYDCEMNREYVKDWAWENRKIAPGDQSYFFSKNARKERVYMAANLDFIITDSPLILTHFYGLKYDPFEQKFNTSLSMLKNHHSICKELGYKVDHFFLKRDKPYSDAGRYQSEEEAKSIDMEIQEMLERSDVSINYNIILADENCVERILEKMEKN
jgi:hypothetical protein